MNDRAKSKEQLIAELQALRQQLSASRPAQAAAESREQRALVVLGEISRYLSTTLDLETMLHWVHSELGKLFDMTNFYIALYTEGAAEWELAWHVVRGERQPPARYRVDQGLTGYILRTREMVCLNNLAENRAFLQARGMSLMGEQARSWLGVPLIAADEVVGVMAIENYEYEDLYTAEDRLLFITVAAQVANVLKSARLFEQYRAALTEMELLYTAGSEIAAAKSYDEVVTLLRKHTLLGEADLNVSIYFFVRRWRGDVMPEWSIPVARWSSLEASAVSARYPLRSFSAAQSLLAADRVTVISDVENDPRLDAATRTLYRQRFKALSTIFAPIVIGGEWWGYINGIYSQRREFPEAVVRRLTNPVSQAGVVLQSLQRLDAVQHRAVQLRTAAEVARVASSFHSLEELLPQSVEIIRERFAYYYVGIFLLDDAGHWAVLRAGTGEAGQAMLAAGHRLEVGGVSMIGTCISRQEARIAFDVGAEAVRFDNPHLPRTRSEMALPLLHAERVLGAMTVQSIEPHAFSPDDVMVIQTIADQLANAIETARLFAEMERNAQQLESAYGTYTQTAWREFVARALQVRGYRYRGLDIELTEQRTPEAAQAWDEGRPVVRPYQAGQNGAATQGAAVAVPIKLREQVIGVLNLRSASAPITADAVAFVEQVANRLGLALETARLVEDTRRRALLEQTAGEVAARIRQKVEIETVLEQALTELTQALGAERAAARLMLLETQGEG